MDQPTDLKPPMAGFLPQYLYELKKGVRPLFLLTMSTAEAELVQKRLEKEAVAFYRQCVSETKVNMFFGQAYCIAMVRSIVTGPLNALSPEQDFILGTLLGYEREQQCRRYLIRASPSARIHSERASTI